jgi:hypothetical protein
MDLETAKNLKKGQEVYSKTMKNADGTPRMAKVTSVKTWKTRPDEVLVKTKRGLYEYGEINEIEIHQITDVEPS